MRSLLAPALLLALAPAASAGILDFSVAKAQSNFTWSGTTSLGPIVGNPSNAFQIEGPQQMSLAPGGAGVLYSAELLSGDLAVTPDLHGQIPNPLPFLPPLATIDVLGLRLSLSSSPFDVAPGGAFSSALVTATALSGTLVVTPLSGSQTTTPLAGLSSDPSLQSGLLTATASGMHWSSPIDVTFPFSDPSSGVSGSITIQGTLVADWAAGAPQVYCTAKTSSSGCTPALSTTGTPSASASSGFTIDASQVEAKKLGIFFFSTVGPASQPFQGGYLCVQSPLTRTWPTSSGGSGACSGVLSLDFNAWLAASAPALRAPGQSFYVQGWFRDPADPTSGTGLTDAVSFELWP